MYSALPFSKYSLTWGKRVFGQLSFGALSFGGKSGSTEKIESLDCKKTVESDEKIGIKKINLRTFYAHYLGY